MSKRKRSPSSHVPSSKKRKIYHNDDSEELSEKEKLEQLKVVDLREICKQHSLPRSGKKADLVERILNSVEESEEDESLEIDLSDSDEGGGDLQISESLEIGSYSMSNSDDSLYDDDANDVDEIKDSVEQLSSKINITVKCSHIMEFVERKKIQSILLNPVNWNCKGM